MNQWIKRIQDHAIFKELIDLEQIIESSCAAAQADATSFEAWERVERVVQFIRTFLSNIDPLLVPPSHLSNSVAQIQQARAQLNNFSSNKNIAHLIETNNHLDNVLSYMGSIPRLDALANTEELGEAASSYRKSIGVLVRSLEKQLLAVVEEKNALHVKLQELTAEVDTQKQRADNVIAQMQQQFSTAQESRQTESVALESKRSTEFEVAEKSRQEQNVNSHAEREKKFSELMVHAKEQLQVIRNQLEDDTRELMGTLEEQKSHAEKIVGIISTEAVAHGYGKTANEERDAAKIWRRTAVGALVVWIIAGLIFFALTYAQDLSFSALARQFLISTPFILLAGFAALQVSKHQRAERVNRQQELEIAAIDPYLATFDDETRNEVKRNLADKLFGQRDMEPTKGDSKQMFDLMTDTLKSVKQLQESLAKK